MSDVNRKMAAGIAWMSLMRFGVKGLGLISTVVLARLLLPADFGLVAMAMSVVAGLELLRAFNFDVALIQRQDADRSFYDTAWTFNIAFGVLLALVLVAIAPVAAAFYKEPRLLAVMQLLAFGAFVSSFENIGVVAFRKDLAFHKEFALRVAQKVCATAVTLPLAFTLRNYWALVIGMVCDNLLAVLISYLAHPFRPRISLAASRQLFSFSKWLLATNLIWFLRDRAPDYVIGRIAGTSALGLFSVSVEISNLPTSELISPMNRAVLPAYAKMAHSLAELREGFLNVLGLIVILALPAGFGIAATSALIVNVVLGPKWSAAVPAISVLAIFGAVNALQTNCGAVHYAMGRPKVVAAVGALQVLLLFPAVVWSAFYYGAIGVAWAYLGVVVIIVPLNFWIVLRRLRFRMGRLLALFWRPAVATAVMYAITLERVASSRDLTLGALVTAVVIGATSYVTILALLWLAAGRPDGPEKTLTGRFLLPTWNRIAS